MRRIFQNAQQLQLTAKLWLSVVGQWKESHIHDSVGAVCVHVCVCVHALTRVTAHL